MEESEVKWQRNKQRKMTAEEINYLYPIQAVSVYEGGVMKVERAQRFKPAEIKRGDKKPIEYLSKSSLSNLAFTVITSGSRLKSLLTLTYGIQYPLCGLRVKEDLNRFLVRMRRRYSGLLYVWFLEFQTRGAPHFHMFTSVENPTIIDRRTMAVAWVEAQKLLDVPYTRLRDRKLFHVKQSVFNFHKTEPKSWERIRHPEGVKRYALKYALKARQKIVPENYRNVGNFWSCSEAFANPHGVRVEVTEEELRGYIEQHNERMREWEVLPKIIF